MTARLVRGTATFIALAVVAVAVWLTTAGPAGPAFGRARADRLQRDVVTQARLDALREARRAGTLGRIGSIPLAPAAGWAGEQLFHPTADDWEPAIATDPNAPFVYILVTRYGVSPPGCQGPCPNPSLVLRRSTDGGVTFGPDIFPCTCRGNQGMFDPIIEVVPNTGHVYAVWMNDFDVVFSKSTNNGVTWSTPVATYGNVSWNDKPILAVSNDGQHVYVAWNGPTSGDAWVAQSHNAGASFTQSKIINSNRYTYAFDGDVAPDGTVYFTESSISYTGPGSAPEGLVEQRVIISRNQGASWENRLIDSVEIGQACVATGCYADFYIGHAALSADVNGNLVFLYDGATSPGGQQRIWSRRSTNAGVTWSARTMLSSGSEHATAPAIESTGNGSVRAFYYQTSGGDHDAWNIWYRSSTDGGQTWGAAVDISDATGGTAYKNANGFLEVYGDYGEMAITNTGTSIAVFGEGASYSGPGGVWVNRQL